MSFVGTFWALVPAIIAIALGIITKEVNLSLIIGIIAGVLLYCNFSPLDSLQTFFEVLEENVIGNLGNLIFAVLLGMFIWLITHSGAAQQYGIWAEKKVKTRRLAQLSTFFLGGVIFVDDYFNCLTVGTVMRPLTDRMKISREKLAYIIDSTAAPICIIAPISSWAAGVSSSLPKDSGIDGFQLFLRTIPANFYALLTLATVFMLIMLKIDFGRMKKYEAAAIEGSYVYDTVKDEAPEPLTKDGKARGKAGVKDLLIPILFLIISTVFFMAYTGGILEGESLVDAFANCNAIRACCMGTFLADLLLLIMYVPRRIYTFKEYLDSLVEGFKYMAPAMLLLCLAWTIGGSTSSGYLNAGAFVSGLVEDYNIPMMLMPMVFFIVSILLSFATGTSWGTFMILIPIEVAVFSGAAMSDMMVITTAAVLGGSVCGDHLSPISDTTILSSAGAGCKHINHVSTQLPYGILVALVSFAGYMVAGLTGIYYLGLAAGFVLLLAVLLTIKYTQTRKEKTAQ